MILAVASLICLAASPVHRVAVVVGANGAPPGRQSLHHAHRDAASMRDVLVRAGGVATDDAVLLLDPAPGEVLEALKHLGARLSAAEGQSVLYFYYSGHSDDSSLYPSGEPLSIESLRDQLAKVPATVRVGIFDACRGGAWTKAKGLSPAPPVDLSMPDSLRSEGTVLFASSSGLEEAHESEAMQGSFFTHHLVAGLLGAADASGDGVVTASEAFVYAQRLTVRDSAGANLDPQHPSFEMNLRGRQDFELTRLEHGTALLAVDQHDGPLQLVELPSGLVLLELPQGKRQARLGVAAGNYLLRRVQDHDVTNMREVTVTAGQTTTVDEASLALVGRQAGGGKSPREFPRAEESTLEKGQLQLGLALGPTYNPTAVALSQAPGNAVISSGYDVGLAAALRFSWAPLDWLELTPLSLGATFRLGERHHLEGLLSLGFDGWGYSSATGFMATPSAQIAGRWWFGENSSAFAWVTGRTSLSGGAPAFSRNLLLGGAGVSHTLAGLVSFNAGLGGTSAGQLTIGGIKLGHRHLPLIQVQLTPTWSVDLDASIEVGLGADRGVTQTYLTGFTATW